LKIQKRKSNITNRFESICAWDDDDDASLASK